MRFLLYAYIYIYIYFYLSISAGVHIDKYTSIYRYMHTCSAVCFVDDEKYVAPPRPN